MFTVAFEGILNDGVRKAGGGQFIDFHGLPVRNITRALENWTVELAEPRRIGG